MTKKWNLQDIRPATPRKRRPSSETKDDMRVSGSQIKEVSDSDQIRQPERQTMTTKLEQEGSSDGTLTLSPKFGKKGTGIVIENGNKKNFSRLAMSIGLFFLIVGSAAGLSALLGKTDLTIYPVNREPNVSAEFTAYPEKRDGELSYEVMTLEATGEQQVKASGQVEVQEQATGNIEIIKTTPGAERLIKNTRFRTDDGLVFRIYESIVVPGSIDGVPGTISAKVFADDVGEEYNVSSNVSLDIPGFKESGLDNLYSAISGRTSSDFTGGFDGTQFKIDESELGTARQALQIELRDNLLARIENEQPADFIAFDPEAVALSFNQLPAVEYGENLVTIREQAILQIPLFKASDLASYIARETVATYDGGDIRIDDPSTLVFSYVNPEMSSMVIANEPAITFKLTGKPLLIWEYDSNNLTENLAGLPKTAINNAVGAYPGIESAHVRVTPFWKRTFPEDPSEINIIEILEDPTADN